MTIVVEDGTNVPGANSYVSVADLTAYAADRQIALPTDNATLEALLIKSMDYLYTFSSRLIGVRSLADQLLPFPRTISSGLYANSGTSIPLDVKRAQIIAAIAAITVDLTPASSGSTQNAKRKTVGPITIEYATSSRSVTFPSVPQVDYLLRPFLTGGFGQPSIVKG